MSPQAPVERMEVRQQLRTPEFPGALKKCGVQDVESRDPVGRRAGRGPGRIVVQAEVAPEPHDGLGRHLPSPVRSAHHSQSASLAWPIGGPTICGRDVVLASSSPIQPDAARLLGRSWSVLVGCSGTGLFTGHQPHRGVGALAGCP